MFAWLFLLAIVLWTVTFWYRRRRLYKLASALPRPKDELPLLGLAHTVVGNTEGGFHRNMDVIMEMFISSAVLSLSELIISTFIDDTYVMIIF